MVGSARIYATTSIDLVISWARKSSHDKAVAIEEAVLKTDIKYQGHNTISRKSKQQATAKTPAK
jgi:hypothetical protein